MTLEQIALNKTMQTAAVAADSRTAEGLTYIGECLRQFYAGNYGIVPAEDTEANNSELAAGYGRIVARYKAAAGLKEDIYIIAFFNADEPNNTDANYTIVHYVSEY